jgi:aryl-alcohol dehydrogenase-like predicted oxidoreductase
MRLTTDAERHEARAVATLHAAVDAGITLFDTAHAYAHDDTELGASERLRCTSGPLPRRACAS